MVQWLGLDTHAVSLGFILVGELICHKLCDMAKKKTCLKAGRAWKATGMVSL